MLSSIARILLTATAIAPISLTYAWVSVYQGQVKIAVACCILGAVLWISCVVLLNYVRNNIEALPFKTASAEPADAESFGFLLLYLLPLFTDKIETLNWELWIPITLVFSIIIGTGYGYHFNPLLSLLRWHFYKITSDDGVTYVLITKKHLRTAARIHRVGQLTEYILIDLEN
ncbi:hypothetical protein BV511_09960 [Methylorubrum extorquens]|uniref:hypothetical protein n=1 Tax=Methylorubrum extorquens TaxID=408 RepID=UPI000972913A|nr:hypothetical protein [Methylorubrum extorquens]APX85009.1 hypothetical protein BV511_09960 [Methylorubrum extorquens]